jgi:hypothetical protein
MSQEINRSKPPTNKLQIEKALSSEAGGNVPDAEGH